MVINSIDNSSKKPHQNCIKKPSIQNSIIMKKLLFLLTVALLTVGACKKDSENSDTNKIEKINVQGTELSINSEIYKALISDNGAKYKVVSNPNGRTSNSIELFLKYKDNTLSIDYYNHRDELSKISLRAIDTSEFKRTSQISIGPGILVFNNFFANTDDTQFLVSDTSLFQDVYFNLSLDTALIDEWYNNTGYGKWHILVFSKN